MSSRRCRRGRTYIACYQLTSCWFRALGREDRDVARAPGGVAEQVDRRRAARRKDAGWPWLEKQTEPQDALPACCADAGAPRNPTLRPPARLPPGRAPPRSDAGGDGVCDQPSAPPPPPATSAARRHRSPLSMARDDEPSDGDVYIVRVASSMRRVVLTCLLPSTSSWRPSGTPSCLRAIPPHRQLLCPPRLRRAPLLRTAACLPYQTSSTAVET